MVNLLCLRRLLKYNFVGLNLQPIKALLKTYYVHKNDVSVLLSLIMSILLASSLSGGLTSQSSTATIHQCFVKPGKDKDHSSSFHVNRMPACEAQIEINTN